MRITGLICAILTLTIALNGCAMLKPTPTDTSQVPVFTEEPVTETGVPETTVAEPETAPKSPAMLRAYQFALQQIAFEHVLPDGSELFFDNSFGFIEENTFAVIDVNGDGRDELLVTYSTAPMAGMRALVYGYDMENDALRLELDVFPGAEMYPGGLVKASWSHNHTYGMDFWPYTLMRYHADTGVYEAEVSVSAWDRRVSETDLEGRSFPEEKDPQQVGTVYLITRGEEETILSQAEFEAWNAEIFAGADAMDIQWQNLTEDNIRALVD